MRARGLPRERHEDPLLGGDRITYLPSGRHSNLDNAVLRLRRNDPPALDLIAAGRCVRPSRGPGVPVQRNVAHAKTIVMRMSAAERREFVAWMKAKGFLEDSNGNGCR
jgi:hypothetical protein